MTARCAFISGAAIAFALGAVSAAFAQTRVVEHKLDHLSGLRPVDVRIDTVSYRGRTAVHVVNPPHSAAGTVVLVVGTDMLNGTIDVDVAGRPMPDATPDVRGFIGLAFRAITDSTYESFYIRVTNGRADDQVRRNHASQYISAPGYTFDRLRREEPDRYEAYVDLAVGEWTHLRAEVRDSTAKFYVNGSPQPVLIVNRLKGKQSPGLVGLWIGDNTDGYFSNLSVRTGERR